MKADLNQVEINGTVYVKEGTTKKQEFKTGFQIIRTAHAGVFAGYPDGHNVNGELLVKDAIRIWYWKGAASLSEMAVSGVNEPDRCKFAVPVAAIYLSGVIERIPCTKEAFDSIVGVKSWTA